MADPRPDGTAQPSPKKPRRMQPHTVAWERMANELARSFAPAIHPCADCGGPVIKGYCCTRCGSDNPEGHK